MEKNQKRRPFHRVLIGIICALIAGGSVLGVLARILIPETYSVPVWSSLFIFVFFLIGAVAFLVPDKGESTISRKEKMKTKRTFFRVGVFFGVWIIIALIGGLCFPPTHNAAGVPMSSSGSLSMSFLGMIIGIVVAYYCPVPETWRDTKDYAEDNEVVVTQDAFSEKKSEPQKESVVYEKEEIEL